MKSEWRVFAIITAFLFVACGVYAYWTFRDSEISTGTGRVEWVGVVALVLSAMLCLMCGGYFLLVSRRIEPRPEDRPDAEISDGAGDIGFFSPSSYWPVGLAGAALITALGMAFWKPWLIAAGAIAVLLGTAGLLFEYYTGTRRAEH